MAALLELSFIHVEARSLKLDRLMINSLARHLNLSPHQLKMVVDSGDLMMKHGDAVREWLGLWFHESVNKNMSQIIEVEVHKP